MKGNTEWATMLQKATASRADKIPTGFRSMEEWLKEYRISKDTWQRRIPILEESGDMTPGHYRVIDRAGRLVNRKFWKRNPK